MYENIINNIRKDIPFTDIEVAIFLLSCTNKTFARGETIAAPGDRFSWGGISITGW